MVSRSLPVSERCAPKGAAMACSWRIIRRPDGASLAHDFEKLAVHRGDGGALLGLEAAANAQQDRDLAIGDLLAQRGHALEDRSEVGLGRRPPAGEDPPRELDVETRDLLQSLADRRTFGLDERGRVRAL